MKKQDCRAFLLLILVVFSLVPSILHAEAESARYISIDEIRPGMEAYCLSVFSGLEVERFELKLLSVVRGASPGRDMILVVGTDDRFQHAGTVHGCSGSPVFIDGRLAGALAAGWDGGLDSLYLVRPIHDMLKVGSMETAAASSSAMAFHYDFSRPLDLQTVYMQSMEQLGRGGYARKMLLPLVSSLPEGVCESMSASLAAMGFVPVSGAGLMPSAEDAGQFAVGGTLAVPLCSGDISMAATGTVTEIVGDQVYGFGHDMTGRGPLELPMSAGLVHTVVAGRSRSFKLATPGPILGTLEFDQSSAVRGTIGKMPKTVPLTITVTRFNDPQVRTYRCQLAHDRSFTPMIARMVLNGAALMQGALPMEHTVNFTGAVRVRDYGTIAMDNLSSGQGTMAAEQALFASLQLLYNNPFAAMEVEGIEMSLDIQPVVRQAEVWAVDVSRTQVEPGASITATVAMRSFRAEEMSADISFTVPGDLPAGTYTLQIMGAADYQRFIGQTAPQRFRVVDGATLFSGLQRLNALRNDRLYAVMAVPATGVVMRQHELPQLPATKMLLMQDSKRLRPIEAYRGWAESVTALDTMVAGTAEIQILVQK